MSREEPQSESQKFKAEALARDVEKRRNLIAKAKNKSMLIQWAWALFLWVSMIALWAIPYLLFKRKPAESLILVPFFLSITYTNFAAGVIHKRIDALIELYSTAL